MGYLGGRPSSAPGAGRHARDAPRSFAWFWAAAAGALASGLVFLLVRGALVDDAHLALAHARTLAVDGVWGAQPQLPDNAVTSPLTVALLAGLISATGRPVLAAGVLVVAAAAAAGVVLGRIAARLRLGRWPPVVTVVLLTVNPLLVASIGTEAPLAVALVGALGLAVLARRPVLAGLLGGLLVLDRVDLVAFALAGILAVALTRGGRSAAAAAVLTAAVGLPWYAVTGVPDTLLVAVEVDLPADPLVTTLALAPAAAGLLVLLVRLAGRTGPVDALHVVWGVGALLHASTYLLLHAAWYVAPAVGALTMLGGLGVPRPSPRTAVLGAFAALAVVTGVDLVMRPAGPAAVSGDLATTAQYRELAGLAPPGGVVASFGQAGTLAYFCGCTVVDPVTDGRAAADARARAGPVGRALLSRREVRPLRPTWRFAIEDGEPVVRPVD